MLHKLFGTDGIRGRANEFPIVPDLIVQIGIAVAKYFSNEPYRQNDTRLKYKRSFNPYIESSNSNHQFTVVIGKDTRLSGYMIESALVAGLVSQGASVIMLGPIPTPAVAMLVKSLRADIGVMISASHNPFFDNGIKFFDKNGLKFSRETEKEIERIISENNIEYPENCGKSMRLDDAVGRYVEFAKATFPKGHNLEKMKIVIDCANGAAYKVAPRVFWELGAEVITEGDTPNGRNINYNCGALHTDELIKTVKDSNADIGISLDGDADRIVIITKNGQIVNGDQIIALIAKNWKDKNILSNGVVTTNMSNIGLKKYLSSNGIEHFESDVGDKHVVKMMNEKKCNVGGEESGHIILNDYTTTGDGIIAALQILSILDESNKTSDEVFPVFKTVPQIMKSYKADGFMDTAFMEALKSEANEFMRCDGNVIIRRSGTEQVIRCLIQSENEKLVSDTFEKIITPRMTK